MTPTMGPAPRLFDNTRVQDFKTCPRLYYFRHVLGWQPDGTVRLPLAFGSAWHKAMETVWQLGTAKLGPGEALRRKAEIVDAAHEAFLAEWQKAGLPRRLTYEEEKDMAPRTPMVAQGMLIQYIDKRWSMLRDPDLKLLSVEKPFIVSLSPDPGDDLFYVGRIDKVVALRGKVLAIEHKTTTQYRVNGPFRAAFIDSFSPNAQVDGYAFALHSLFEAVGGIWVDAALVHRSENACMIIPVERRREHLDAWLWEVHYWIAMIQQNLDLLAEVATGDSYMAAFPKQTASCFNYGSACAFLNVCKAWPNPKGREPPPSYHEERWDPLAHVGPYDSLQAMIEAGAIHAKHA